MTTRTRRAPKKRSHFLAGFTLIELLVVISIISLLSSIVLASLAAARARARDAERQSNISEIGKALELYYYANGNTYPSGTYLSIYSSPGPNSWLNLAADLQPYLSTLPIDPLNQDVSCFGPGAHFYTYVGLDGGQGYGIYASLEQPKNPPGPDPDQYPSCGSGYYGGNSMYQAIHGGIGVVVRGP